MKRKSSKGLPEFGDVQMSQEALVLLDELFKSPVRQAIVYYACRSYPKPFTLRNLYREITPSTYIPLYEGTKALTLAGILEREKCGRRYILRLRQTPLTQALRHFIAAAERNTKT